MGFYVRYDDKRLAYVGLCDLHPLYSAYAETAEDAMSAIIALVDGLDLDNETTDVTAMDTDELDITNVFWPPWVEL